MKRNAFTLIELIFVIILLSILSSVAVVKMGQMAENAKLAQLKSFVGTLNRTTSAAIWADSMSDDRNGSVAFADYEADIEKKYIELLPNFISGPSLINCNSDGNGTFLSYTYENNYEIHCKDGISTTSPKFRLYNQSDDFYID